MILTEYQQKQQVIWWSCDEYLMIMYWISAEYCLSSNNIVRLCDDYLMIISSPFLDFQIICWPCYYLLLIMWGSSEDHLIIISRISDCFMLIFRCSFGDNLWKIMIIICRIFFDHLNIIGRLSADNLKVICLLFIGYHLLNK